MINSNPRSQLSYHQAHPIFFTTFISEEYLPMGEENESLSIESVFLSEKYDSMISETISFHWTIFRQILLFDLMNVTMW